MKTLYFYIRKFLLFVTSETNTMLTQVDIIWNKTNQYYLEDSAVIRL